MAGASAMYGALFGLLPIGWIVLNIIFLYQLTKDKGYFKILQDSIAGVTEDRRLQLLLIAFAFGAFFEGAAGFGTPVAVTGAILIGLGFSPLAASGLSLIANTAPVAYGALGTPIIALSAVTGLDLLQLSAHGRTPASILLAAGAVLADLGFCRLARHEGDLAGDPGDRRVLSPFRSFSISNYHGPWLVDVGAAIISMACLTWCSCGSGSRRTSGRTTALKGTRKGQRTAADVGASMRGRNA